MYYLHKFFKTASESYIVIPWMVKAFSVTYCKSDYASLFLEVLNAHIATLTKESLDDIFLFFKNIWELQIYDSVPSNLLTIESRQNQT